MGRGWKSPGQEIKAFNFPAPHFSNIGHAWATWTGDVGYGAVENWSECNFVDTALVAPAKRLRLWSEAVFRVVDGGGSADIPDHRRKITKLIIRIFYEKLRSWQPSTRRDESTESLRKEALDSLLPLEKPTDAPQTQDPSDSANRKAIEPICEVLRPKESDQPEEGINELLAWVFHRRMLLPLIQ